MEDLGVELKLKPGSKILLGGGWKQHYAQEVDKSRLYDLMLQEQNDKISAERRSQVGSGDRSERIRTYNFPQGRITDHRINLTLYKLDSFLDGDIDEVIDALITHDQAEKMKQF